MAPDLRKAAEAVEIFSASRYAFLGQARVAEGGDGGESPLVRAVAEDLYDRLYSRWGTPASRPDDPLARREHLAALSRAHRGRGTWDPGWQLRRIAGDGRVVVSKDGVDFWADGTETRCRGALRAGVPCRVRIPGELREQLPGFYLALGNAPRGEERGAWVVRLYWHLRADAAARWLGVLGGALDAREIPFRLKVPDTPRHYRRADAGVLYLDPGAYGAARDVLRDVHRRLRDGLRSEVPMLTLRLAAGLGLAEGPADGASFGQHRCRLIARALAAAFAAGRVTPGERAEAVAGAFREHGLDPRRPHLSAGSSRVYETFGHHPPPRRPGRSRDLAAEPPSFAEAARRIGDALCREAFRHEDRCNWMGFAGATDAAAGVSRPALAALGPDLYGGTAGVGLFLAELYARSREPEHRRTALAALRQALGASRGDPGAAPPPGFYVGRLGIAWAARRVAALTGDHGLGGRAEDLVARWLEGLRGGRTGDGPLDVLTGHAGAILALLGLWRESGETRFRQAAETLGGVLCRAAVEDGPAGDRRRRERCWRWPAERVSPIAARRMLTGFSHGAAGLGLALLELFAAVRRPAFLAAGRGALAYEDACFRRDAGHPAGNWPDFRTAAGSSFATLASSPGNPAAEEAEKFMTAWCHGAPGIALSRLRAMAVDPERAPPYEAAARAGLETTRRRLEEGLADPDADASLCHGLSGLVDVLVRASAVLGEPRDRERAGRAMRRLLARHGERGSWPSGVPSGGRNPSLMLGAAGVGYTLLRLEDPEGVPSPLLPGEGGGRKQAGPAQACAHEPAFRLKC